MDLEGMVERRRLPARRGMAIVQGARDKGQGAGGKGLGDGQATGGPSNRADEREWVKRVVLRQAQHALSLSKGAGAESLVG